MAVRAFRFIGAEYCVLIVEMTIGTFGTGFEHDVSRDFLFVEGPSLIESFLQLMASRTVFFWILMVTGRAALLRSDELAVLANVRVTGITLDVLFDEMIFMREIETENI